MTELFASALRSGVNRVSNDERHERGLMVRDGAARLLI